MKINGLCSSLYLTIILLLPIVLLSKPLHAEIYTWIDETGRVHFSDCKSQQHESEQLELKINSYHSVKIEPLESTPREGTSKNVVMYSTSWCGYCKKARNYFKQQNIPFNEYDIEKSKRAHRKYTSHGGTGSVPLILVGSQKMRGFDIMSFNRLYFQ